MESTLNTVKSTYNSGFHQIISNYIFVFYFLFWCIRLINIDQLILDGAGVRQILTASVSRFLFIEGISLDNFLYPKLYMAEQNEYYLIEMPLYNALMVLLCKIYGSYEEWIGRFISILFSGLAGVYFYLFLINYTSQRIAKIALILYCFSPLSIIYTRAIQPNPSMLFFLMGTIFYWDEYLREPQRKTYCLTILFGGILFVLNASLQTIGVLFLCLAIRKYGVRIFSKLEIYFSAICMLIPCWLWIIHANNFIQKNLTNLNVQIGPINKNSLSFSSFSWLTDYSFYKAQFQFFSGEILTPIGFGLFILGLGLLRKKDSVLIFWLISFGIYFVLINKQIHLYYYLPWLFPMVWVIAKSISFIYDNLPIESIYRKGIGLFLLIFITLGIIAGYSNSGFITPNAVKMVPDAAKSLNKYFPGDVFGVISSSNVGALEYYVNKKVKVLKGKSTQEKMDEFKEILRDSKPKFYLSIYPDTDYINKNVFSNFLRENYKVEVLEKGEFVLYIIEENKLNT